MSRALAACAFAMTLTACTPPSVPVAADKADSAAAQPYADSWSGRVAGSAPVRAIGVPACPTEDGPVCDHHRLEVPAGVTKVLVAIQAGKSEDEEIYTNDLDLYVYDADGNLLATGADKDGNESAEFEPNGAAYYDVRVAANLAEPDTPYIGFAQERGISAP